MKKETKDGDQVKKNSGKDEFKIGLGETPHSPWEKKKNHRRNKKMGVRKGVLGKAWIRARECNKGA